MKISKENFGVFDGTDGTSDVYQYTLDNEAGLIVKVISYGAGISDIIQPNKEGLGDHVILGFDSLQGYLNSKYIGSTIGRHGNRIGKATFDLDGVTYKLSANNNGNHLHGGEWGWNSMVWESYASETSVVFSLTTPDGDMGYPGAVMAQVEYSLCTDGSLQIRYQAMTSKATPINMTNHSFFNLAGHSSGYDGLKEHEIQIAAQHYLPVNQDLIPTGEEKSVEGTDMDLLKPINVGHALSIGPEGGFDHCFVTGRRGELKEMAKVRHPQSGRLLTVSSTEGGLQFYTSNFIPSKKGVMVGRGDISYTYRGAFCLEPQNHPDAINKSNFPCSVLHPGKIYDHTIVYKFETTK